MKYKLLLTGTHQALISDFFYHMDFSFECLSTSIRADDILGHLKYYEPDALVYCLNGESSDDIRSFLGVIHSLSSRKIYLIIVGDQEDCSEFEKIFPLRDYLTIVRPCSTKGMEEKILAFLDAHAAEIRAEKEDQVGDDYRETMELVDKMMMELEKGEESTQKGTVGKEPVNTDEPMEDDGKKHVLIVDDDSGVLKLVRGILGDRYHVATAINGKVAMKFLENKKTDLILLDYEMPGESGAEVLQKIRNNEKLKELPVVFLTGVTEKKRIHEVLALSPQGYILKPINAERLNSTLKEIFGK